MKKRRTSNIVKYCSKHGKFVGFAWGGHRRICRNGKEVDEARWYASLKPKGTSSDTKLALRLPVMTTAVQKALLQKKVAVSNPARVMPIRKPYAARAVVTTDAGNLVAGIQSHLFDLDGELEKLVKIKMDAERKIDALSKERDGIKDALRKFI